MSKLANRWESPLGTMLPYLQWSELTDGEISTWEIGRHNHAFYELHIILSGQCRLFVDNTELTLQAGQGILLAPEVFHGPDDVLKPFCRFSLAFFPEETQLHRWLPGENGFLLFSADETVTDQCKAIFEELKKKDSLFHKELLSGQFAQLMLRVFRAVQENASDARAVMPHPKQLEDMTVIDRFFCEHTPQAAHQGKSGEAAALLFAAGAAKGLGPLWGQLPEKANALPNRYRPASFAGHGAKH